MAKERNIKGGFLSDGTITDPNHPLFHKQGKPVSKHLPDNVHTAQNRRIANLESQVEILIKQVKELKAAHSDKYEHECYLS